MLTVSEEGNKITVVITRAQYKFLQSIEKKGWGDMKLAFKNGDPVMGTSIEPDEKYT